MSFLQHIQERLINHYTTALFAPTGYCDNLTKDHGKPLQYKNFKDTLKEDHTGCLMSQSSLKILSYKAILTALRVRGKCRLWALTQKDFDY